MTQNMGNGAGGLRHPAPPRSTGSPPSATDLSSAGAVALGGRNGMDRASIEASVAVATLFYGSSGSVCAHACVLCVSSCVWLGNRVENSSSVAI